MKARGTEFMSTLLDVSDKIHCTCAGWITDEYTWDFVNRSRVEYLGLLSQEKANEYLSQYATYIVGIYPTNNLNNIYASPNKIYDAIHTRTPIIINKEVQMSKFVIDHDIGLVVNENDLPRQLVENLFEKKDSFLFDSDLIRENSWDNYEETLLELHGQGNRR